jgi:molybdopterin-binding protein
MRLSARNQLPAVITKISRGASIATVELDVGGQRVVASITVEAVDDLGLTEGASVFAVVKASDVMIGVAHD